MPKTDIFLRFLTSIEERGLYITEKIGKKIKHLLSVLIMLKLKT